MMRFVAVAVALALTASAAGAQQTGPAEFPEPPAAQTEPMPSRTIPSEADTPRQPESPVLAVDQERLFTGSAWGKRAIAELEEAGNTIAAENERLAAQLSQEEADLTEQRKTLDAAEFRKRAEAFDARATEVRRDRAQAVQDLNDRAEADRNAFYQAALPVMGEMMKARGAVAVLDRRTLFVSLDAIDITGDLIAELDKVLGEGPGIAAAQPAGDETPAAGN